MNLLRPLLLALLGAFAAAAPAAPVAVARQGKGHEYTHALRQSSKSDAPTAEVDARAAGERAPELPRADSAAGAPAIATPDDSTKPWPAEVVSALRPVTGPTTRRKRDLRAGLLALPPPSTLRTA